MKSRIVFFKFIVVPLQVSYFTLNKIKINGGARRYLQNKKIKTIKFAIHKVVISRLHASQLASRRSGSIQNKMRRRSNKALKTTSWRRSFSPPENWQFFYAVLLFSIRSTFSCCVIFF